MPIEAFITDKHGARVYTYVENALTLYEALSIIQTKESRDQMYYPHRGDSIVIKHYPPSGKLDHANDQQTSNPQS